MPCQTVLGLTVMDISRHLSVSDLDMMVYLFYNSLNLLISYLGTDLYERKTRFESNVCEKPQASQWVLIIIVQRSKYCEISSQTDQSA